MIERCDHCGPLGWTINAYGCITHKHSCPHSCDDFCQAHPRGCDLVADQRGLRRITVEWYIPACVCAEINTRHCPAHGQAVA